MTPRVRCLAFITAISALIGATSSLAYDIKTTTGAVYHNATITRAEPDGVVISHRTGVAKVLFTELPVEIQQKYHYDVKRAEEYQRQHEHLSVVDRPDEASLVQRGITASPSAPAGAASAAPTVATKTDSPTKSLGVALPNEILNSVVTISGPRGEGTGFVCNYKGRPFVASNQHVLGCGGPIAIRTDTGQALMAKRFAAAPDEDIVLIECESIPDAIKPLELATMPNEQIHSGDEIIVPGNSQGRGVITETRGKLLAIGPQRIEVDNPVYHGNSGSPIIHRTTNKVVGILTKFEHIDLDKFEKESFRSKNSAIKSEFRIIGYRVDSVQTWQNLNWFAFQATEQNIKTAREELNAIVAYFTNSSSSYKDFKELHVLCNEAAKVSDVKSTSKMDKLAAYQRLLRNISFLARRSAQRLDGNEIYFAQRNDVDNIHRLSNLLQEGVLIAQREDDLATTLLQRGK